MNSSISKISLLLFSVLVFLFTACDSAKDEKDTTAPATDVSREATEPSVSPMRLTPGKLDTLWIAAADFKKLDKNKANFIFYFGTNDTITVHGWKDKGGADPYNTPPDVQFIKGNADTALTYGPGTYFGNLVLDRVNIIRNKLISGNYSHIIFAPKKIGNHVYYKIYFSDEPHVNPIGIMALYPALEDANPSPPKKF